MKVRVLIIVLLLIGIAIQFVRPALDNPPVTGDLQAPPEVKAILMRACYDCHSNQTRLAWFDQPAPAYWLVVRDVVAGRRVLNFSNWDSLSKPQQAAKLFESVMQIEQQGMPLSSYMFLHHGGIVSADELEVLKRYVGSLAYRPVVDTVRERAAAAQRAISMASSGTATAAAKDTYNGIAYASLAGWPGWQSVSTTERYDNGTFRVIFGNDITVKAIREGKTNPYPDGAIFAKAAWDQLPDSAGMIWAGAFKQVEFMIRDSKKYASTFGWGWARWVGGLDLKPYGKDASFVTECMNCHRPLDKTDHTFTFPLVDSMRGKVITSFVNTKDSTMSVLYSNEAVYSLVTWSQRDDPHWFGGRIPGGVHSVGMVTKKAGDTTAIARLVQYITAKRASVMPHP